MAAGGLLNHIKKSLKPYLTFYASSGSPPEEVAPKGAVDFKLTPKAPF